MGISKYFVDPFTFVSENIDKSWEIEDNADDFEEEGDVVFWSSIKIVDDKDDLPIFYFLVVRYAVLQIFYIFS